MNSLQKLCRYKAWADGRFLTVVGTVPEPELTAPRPILFGSLIRTLHHAYSMDYVWQCHLLGRPHGLTTRHPATHPAMAELDALQRGIDQWYVAYADGLSGDAMDEVIAFEFIGGSRGTMARSDILLHVVNHTTYHRGHAADILYGLKVTPPVTDYPVFLRELAQPA